MRGTRKKPGCQLNVVFRVSAGGVLRFYRNASQTARPRDMKRKPDSTKLEVVPWSTAFPSSLTSPVVSVRKHTIPRLWPQWACAFCASNISTRRRYGYPCSIKELANRSFSGPVLQDAPHYVTQCVADGLCLAHPQSSAASSFKKHRKSKHLNVRRRASAVA